MNKILYSFIIALMICMPLKANALVDKYNNHEGCSYATMSELKEMASLVNFSYAYDNVSLMTITASNLQAGFYIKDEYNFVYAYDTNRQFPGLASISKYYDNQSVDIKFYASSASTCSGELILSKSIKLPRHNQYYGNVLCDGINADKFPLCSKWYPTYVSEYDFKVKVEEYKKSLTTENEKPIVEEKNTFSIIEWLTNNYHFILYGVIGITAILIIILSIRERRRSVL